MPVEMTTMNMTIANMHTPPPSVGGILHQAGPDDVAKSGQARNAAPALTITQAESMSGDIEVSDLPADALDRNDSLGKLVSGVFNMPAPPMPDFN